ncbi:putative exosome complex component rrp40 [Actinia tenebrosa]|uniref:Exosome complex component RRP40 n=1 Tax=Actinia tenebrosa TaxID=6105 RepID=A0A6P8IV31_ACTTE|nr:putative exosome complex component rrp40 [Actinia tenebrosa]
MAANMVNRVVMPGDILGSIQDIQHQSENKNTKPRLGPGLRQEKDIVIAFKSGVLRHRSPATFWIDTNQKRYIPVKEERVIGVVLNKAGDNFKVDIGTSISASLSSLAFEGATKKNRPNLQIGDIVYARLAVANKDMEPELDCTDGSGHSTGLGPLNGGFMFTCSLGLSRKLLSKDFTLLPLIGKYFPFECTVGSNGRVWINAKTLAHVIAISNAITNAEYMTDKQIHTMVRQLVEGIM